MRKSVYIFFCAVLGALLLVVIERALSVLYFLMYNIDYASYGFNLSLQQVQTIDTAALVAAIVLGGLYGIWLGRHWYALIYEKRSRVAPKPVVTPVQPEPVAPEPVSIAKSSRPMKAFAERESPGAWEVDDLLAKLGKKSEPLQTIAVAEPVKSVVKTSKLATATTKPRKTVRKPVSVVATPKRKTVK